MPSAISVAIASFNGARFSLEQLESIAAQTMPPCEIVICDDGSSDGTIELIEKFASGAAFPVRLFRNERNLGYPDNFLKAASLCRGEWIAFCDQDDFWAPIKIERVLETIEKYDDDKLLLVGHSSLVADEQLQPTGRRTPDFKKDRMVRRGGHFGLYSVEGFSMVCRADLLAGVDADLRPKITPSNPLPMAHDQWISTLANAAGDLAYISEPLVIWRRHGKSVSAISLEEEVTQNSMQHQLGIGAASYRALALGTANFAISLEAISTKKVGFMKDNFLQSASKFRKMSQIYSARGKLYESCGFGGRLASFLSMIAMNAYFGDPYYKIGWRSFAKDLIFVTGLIADQK